MSRHSLIFFVDETKDGGEVVGTEPMNVRVFLEPGDLLAHVASCVRLYLADGFVEGNEAIEIIEHLLVTHRVEGIE